MSDFKIFLTLFYASRIWRILPIIGLFLGGLISARAQWATQAIPLKAGWNAVYLLVDPYPDSCDEIFANTSFTPISVRTYQHEFQTTQFLSDPSQTIPSEPEWLTWVPQNSEVGFARSLFALRVGRAYFIEMPAGSPNIVWQLKGRVVHRPIDWKGDAFNLVGFRLDTVSPPTFASYFSSSPEHVNQSIYRMNASGVWVKVANPATTTMVSGEAFWIAMARPSPYQGPIRIQADQEGQIDFGRILNEITITVHNDSSIARTVRVTTPASDTQPVSFTNTVFAGQAPLSFFESNMPTRTFGWTPFGQVDVAIPAKSSREVRVAIRRKDMNPLIPPLNGVYQRLIQIADLGGPSRILLPVRARGLEVFDNEGNPQHPFSGMWGGYARITKVNQPSSLQPTTPTPTASEFTFRLLVHVDGNGQARLLSWVLQMFKEGTFTPDPQDPSKNIIDEPGRQVWITRRDLFEQFTGSTMRDGEVVARRLSSAAFSFDAPVPLTGDFAATTGALTTSLSTASGHALNPFKHKFHPDHNNLDERYEQTIEEAFPFTRHIEMQFTLNDPEGLAQAGYCETVVGGIYRERIEGLYKHDPLNPTANNIRVEGIFRLNLISRAKELNDGLGL